MIVWNILAVMYVRLVVKLLKLVYTFCSKICDAVNNYIQHGKISRISRFKIVIYILQYNACASLVTEFIDMLEILNTLITINCGTCFCSLVCLVLSNILFSSI